MSHTVSSPAQRSACPTSCWRSLQQDVDLIPESLIFDWTLIQHSAHHADTSFMMSEGVHGRLSLLAPSKPMWVCLFCLHVRMVDCLFMFLSAFPASLLFTSGKNPQSARTALISQLQTTLSSLSAGLLPLLVCCLPLVSLCCPVLPVFACLHFKFRLPGMCFLVSFWHSSNLGIQPNPTRTFMLSGLQAFLGSHRQPNATSSFF